MQTMVTRLCCVIGILAVAHASGPSWSTQLKVLDIVVGKTTFADVQAKFGEAVIARCSGGEEANKQMCYSSTGAQHIKLILESGFSGGWSEIDGFKVVSGQLEDRCSLTCTETRMVPDDLRTDGSLRLGMSKGAVIRLLGTPNRASSKELNFLRQSKRRMTLDEVRKETETFHSPVTMPFWDVQTKIDIGLAGSEVSSIEVTQVVSY
jgi:hypothetical protein